MQNYRKPSLINKVLLVSTTFLLYGPFLDCLRTSQKTESYAGWRTAKKSSQVRTHFSSTFEPTTSTAFPRAPCTTSTAAKDASRADSRPRSTLTRAGTSSLCSTRGSTATVLRARWKAPWRITCASAISKCTVAKVSKAPQNWLIRKWRAPFLHRFFNWLPFLIKHVLGVQSLFIESF